MSSKPARILFRLSLTIAVALSVYVLSYGPALRYHAIPGPFLKAFYGPLDAAMNGCDPFERAMRWYLLRSWNIHRTDTKSLAKRAGS